MVTDLREHLASFQSVWQGGFFAADPLRPDDSPYGLLGYVGVPHSIYLACVRQYVTAETVAVEIGPGRGAWTRTLLPAREVWALDALSAEHNRFWEYVGDQPHVRYVQVEDFSCGMLPDNAFDFAFSYDALCHVPFDGIEAYAEALLRKLRPGAHAFWMVADLDKYRRFVELHRSVAAALTSQIGRGWARRFVERIAARVEARQLDKYREFLEMHEGPEGNWWYHAGTDRTAEMLERVGYRVVDRDVGADPRSPIVHFVRR